MSDQLSSISGSAARRWAVRGIKGELQEDISALRLLARRTTLAELLYYVRVLHWVRVLGSRPRCKDQGKSLFTRTAPRIEESIKSLIQFLYKFGSGRLSLDRAGVIVLDGTLTQRLLKLANQLHGKFELLAIAKLFRVSLCLTDKGRVRIDFRGWLDDADFAMYFSYSVRIAADTLAGREDMKQLEGLLAYFVDEYQACSELLEAETGVGVSDYAELIGSLCELVRAKLTSVQDSLVMLPSGRLDIQPHKNILLLSSCLLHKRRDILDRVGHRYAPVIDNLLLSREDFDEGELRYDLLARRPLLAFDDDIIISPELLIDSLFLNAHYTLLESANAKHEYKRIYSDRFVDRISRVAACHGYQEVCRGLELREGGRQFGDVDLVLKDAQAQFLLVEAKNHALPLPVYFGDIQATRARLQQLTKDWESKVLARVAHLQRHHDTYGIGTRFRYVIVTRYPEILSHRSKVLTLSLYEFGRWIAKDRKISDFDQLMRQLYPGNGESLTEQDLAQMLEEGIIVAKPGNSGAGR